jgi:hypothetical protein
MNPRISFSGLERAHECPASVAIAVQVQSTGAAAERGDEIHAYVEAVLGHHKAQADALADVPLEHRQTCADIDWGTMLRGCDLDGDGVRCEVAYAIDVATGNVRELGRGLKRKYGDLSPTEIPGALDFEATLTDGRPCVTDVKTGQPVTRCADNWQMRAQAYALHVKTGAPSVVARLAYIDDKGGVFLDEHTFDAFDLADFPTQLQSIIRRADEAKTKLAMAPPSVTLAKGEWCKYCPAFQSCPAQVAMMRTLMPSMAEMGAADLSALAPAQVGALWARFKELAPIVKKVDDALKAYVRAHPGQVELPDGKVIMEIEKGRTSVNAERALALARGYGATEEEMQSCVRRAEWTELRAVKRKTEKKAKGAGEVA